ncbi:MAG: T9SS type A sorting domain-containing protein [Bacteroidetes bacterium]|nr:T9SS type A sorting domain-containing protein [Bacteroidota bacterium]
MKSKSIIISFAILLLNAWMTFGQYTSQQSGKWTDVATWGTASAPLTGSTVTIATNTTVLLDFNYSFIILQSITIQTGGKLIIEGNGHIGIEEFKMQRFVRVDGELEITSGGILECHSSTTGAPITINGSMNISSFGGGLDAYGSSVTVKSGGSITFCDGDILCGALNLDGGANLYVGSILSGSIWVAGSAALSGDVLPLPSSAFPSTTVIDATTGIFSSGILSVGGYSIATNYTGYGTLTLLSGSDVQYIANGNQAIDASKNYYSLTLKGSGNKTVNALLSVGNEFHIEENGVFVNSNKNVTCGSSFINNSTGLHSLGTGTYTFTGTTIGGSGSTDFSSATVNFSGSSITIGDGTEGDGNLTFGNVSFTNTNSSVTVGANAYAGAVLFNGTMSLSGDNASLFVQSGSVGMNALTVSGHNSSVQLNGNSVSISGNATCGNDLLVRTATNIAGDVSVNGDLTIEDDFDVTGKTDVGGVFRITGSGGDENVFTDQVTVTGSVVNLSGGTNTFLGGLTHSTSAVGSTCTLGGTYSVGSAGTAPTIINAENVAISGAPDFHSLTISNANGTFSSSASFTIRHTANFAKDLDMGTHILTFAPNAPLTSMLGSAEIIGTVQRTLQTVGTYTFNGANTSLLIPGFTAPEVYEFVLRKMAPDAQAISRCYDIRLTTGDVTPPALMYALSLQYKDAEMNGNDENLLMLAYGAWNTATEDQFTKLPTSNVNVTSNIVTYHFDGLTSLNHRYTLADLTAPLPVELVAFAGRRKDRSVELRWKTATELNNHGFEIERARTKDGPFELLGFVEGMGTKSTESTYLYADDHAPETSVYYRLRQIDRDGKDSYSPVVEVSMGEPSSMMTNYPNPFNPSTVLTFSAPEDGIACLRVFNALGQKVADVFNASVMRGETISVPFDAAHLPGGTYFSVLTIGTHTQTGKMILAK